MISSYIVVYHGYLIDQLDDHNIFLNEIFQEEVYMKQSSGFIHPTISFHICHFYKSLWVETSLLGKVQSFKCLSSLYWLSYF